MEENEIIMQMISDQKDNMNQRFDYLENQFDRIHKDFKLLSNDNVKFKNNFRWVKGIGYSFLLILLALIPVMLIT